MALNSELFGVKSSVGLGIDAMVPETSEQFDDFSKAVVEKVSKTQTKIGTLERKIFQEIQVNDTKSTLYQNVTVTKMKISNIKCKS